VDLALSQYCPNRHRTFIGHATDSFNNKALSP
jgi:hypothetical protein